MEYLLNMGLSGSLMLMLYLLIKLAAGGRLSDGWGYVMLKCILAYYLVPIPFLKRLYGFVLGGLILGKNAPEWYVLYADEYRMLFDAEWVYFSPSLRTQMVMGGILTGIAAVVVARKIREYLGQKKVLLRCRGNAGEEPGRGESCRALQERVGLKREVVYIDSTLADEKGNTAFTMGVRKPVVLYPAKRDGREVELILEHEMRHIKKRDVLWRILVDIACVLHCYNPFVWLFAGEFETVSEMACDAEVVRGKGEEERAGYARLLIEMAEKTTKEVKWSAQASRNKKKVEKRVKRIMKKDQKYFGKAVSAALVGAAVFLSSLTAFAYDDVKVWKTDAESTEILESFFQSDMGYLQEETDAAETGFLNDTTMDMEVLYDTQFVDEAGNIYEVKDDAVSIMKTCTHEFSNGTVAQHLRDSSGGCTLTYYSAQRCDKCEMIVIIKRIKQIIYDECPH